MDRFHFMPIMVTGLSDFTKIDQSFGNDNDLMQLVSEAHKRGIKVLLDAVINHPGYSTLADLQFDHIDVAKTTKILPKTWAHWHLRKVKIGTVITSI